MCSLVTLSIFNNTPFIYGANGINGLNYEALKDQCKWHGVKAKEFVPYALSCVNSLIKGINSK